MTSSELRPQRAAGLSANTARTRKRSEIIARDIVRYIIEQQLPEGAVLPNERDMVGTFGVGRVTLREAIRLLETRGVLTLRPGPRGGPIVRRPRPEDFGEALVFILQFSDASFADVMEARQALEPLIARNAASRITTEQLAALKETVTAILDDLENEEAFHQKNWEFHQIIGEASGNVVLSSFIAALRSIGDGRAIGIQYSPVHRKAVALAHQRIVEALERHNPGAAQQEMESHLAEAANYWRRKYPHFLANAVRWV